MMARPRRPDTAPRSLSGRMRSRSSAQAPARLRPTRGGSPAAARRGGRAPPAIAREAVARGVPAPSRSRQCPGFSASSGSAARGPARPSRVSVPGFRLRRPGGERVEGHGGAGAGVGQGGGRRPRRPRCDRRRSGRRARPARPRARPAPRPRPCSRPGGGPARRRSACWRVADAVGSARASGSFRARSARARAAACALRRLSIRQAIGQARRGRRRPRGRRRRDRPVLASAFVQGCAARSASRTASACSSVASGTFRFRSALASRR